MTGIATTFILSFSSCWVSVVQLQEPETHVSLSIIITITTNNVKVFFQLQPLSAPTVLLVELDLIELVLILRKWQNNFIVAFEIPAKVHN